MSSSASTRPAADTQEKILDAAESLFVEHGFAATSLRAIAAAANVNLAATNYHFGSKQGLLAATLHRSVHPINAQRLALLAQVQKSEDPPTIRNILEAFFMPLVKAVESGHVPALIGRMYAEPESLTKPIMEAEFGEVTTSYQRALMSILPGITGKELRWRFHFMIGSMIHLLQFQSPLGIQSSKKTFIEGVERMIDYAQAGLEQADGGNTDV
jgi:AcrR family transcriptional regulator